MIAVFCNLEIIQYVFMTCKDGVPRQRYLFTQCP